MNINGNAFIVGGGKQNPSIGLHQILSNRSANLHQGSGIGKACAIGLAKDGAAGILIADMNLEAASRVVAECKAVATASNFRAESFQIDISQEESVEKATKYMTETFGRIDYCINCAGVSLIPTASSPGSISRHFDLTW
jgi:NAD(P)-dependent dehydrogenase (short-subunit alcohol dehydrogenase family)